MRPDKQQPMQVDGERLAPRPLYIVVRDGQPVAVQRRRRGGAWQLLRRWLSRNSRTASTTEKG